MFDQGPSPAGAPERRQVSYVYQDKSSPANGKHPRRVLRSTEWLGLMICATASAITPAALAQEAIKEPNWPAIRKADLAAIDRTTVQRWLDAQIQNLISNEDIPATRDAASKFHKKLMEQLTASDAAAPFKEPFGSI